MDKFNYGVVFIVLAGLFNIMKIIPTILLLISGSLFYAVIWCAIFGSASYVTRRYGEKYLNESLVEYEVTKKKK